ncbi:MAG: 30S ribosomal protein S6 [Patescibacteria group bacterium]
MQEDENKEDVLMSSNTKESGDGRVYELGYLIVPTISDENIPAKYSALKDLIVNMSGELISDEMPKLINLAYTMDKVIQNVHNKFDTAYFAWIKFDMDPKKVGELKKKLDLDVELVRFLILKTVRENTIAAKRFIGKDSRRKIPSTKKEGEAEIPIDKEEIDKEVIKLIKKEKDYRVSLSKRKEEE